MSNIIKLPIPASRSWFSYGETMGKQIASLKGNLCRTVFIGLIAGLTKQNFQDLTEVVALEKEYRKRHNG